MSQILSPPQRRPDLIGQCKSCKTIAIFGEEEQWVDEEFVPVEPKIERSFGDKPDLVIPLPPKKVIVTTAACQTEWCRTRGQRVKLHRLESSIGTWLKEEGEGNPAAAANFILRQIDEALAPMREVKQLWDSQKKIDEVVAEARARQKPTLRDRICDAWDWFWRKE